MDRCLTFDDLGAWAEGAEIATSTPELREALARHAQAFLSDEEQPEPMGALVMFRARGPQPRALIVHLSHLWGTIGQNLSNIEGTAPDGYLCDAQVRTL